MSLAEDDDMIEAFPAVKADKICTCPFCQGDLRAIG